MSDYKQLEKQLQKLLYREYKTEIQRKRFNSYAEFNKYTLQDKINFLSKPVAERRQLMLEFDYEQADQYNREYYVSVYYDSDESSFQVSDQEATYLEESRSLVSSDSIENSQELENSDEVYYTLYTYEELKHLVLNKQQYAKLLRSPFYKDIASYLFVVIYLEDSSSLFLQTTSYPKDSKKRDYNQSDLSDSNNEHSHTNFLVQLDYRFYDYYGNHLLNSQKCKLRNLYFKVAAPRALNGYIVNFTQICTDLNLIYKYKLYREQFCNKKLFRQFNCVNSIIPTTIYQQKIIPGSTLNKQQQPLTKQQLLNLYQAVLTLEEDESMFCLNSFFNYPGNLHMDQPLVCIKQCNLRIRGLHQLMIYKLQYQAAEDQELAEVLNTTDILAAGNYDNDVMMDRIKKYYDQDVIELLILFQSKLYQKDAEYYNILKNDERVVAQSRFIEISDTGAYINQATRVIRQYMLHHRVELSKSSEDTNQEVRKPTYNFILGSRAGQRFQVNLVQKTISNSYSTIFLMSCCYKSMLLRRTPSGPFKQWINYMEVDNIDGKYAIEVEYLAYKTYYNGRTLFLFDVVGL